MSFVDDDGDDECSSPSTQLPLPPKFVFSFLLVGCLAGWLDACRREDISQWFGFEHIFCCCFCSLRFCLSFSLSWCMAVWSPPRFTDTINQNYWNNDRALAHTQRSLIYRRSATVVFSDIHQTQHKTIIIIPSPGGSQQLTRQFMGVSIFFFQNLFLSIHGTSPSNIDLCMFECMSRQHDNR